MPKISRRTALARGGQAVAVAAAFPVIPNLAAEAVQAFADSLEGPSDASRARKQSAVKSLLSFGHRIGYLPFDVGRPVRLPRIKDTIAERILPEDTVLTMIALEPS